MDASAAAAAVAAAGPAPEATEGMHVVQEDQNWVLGILAVVTAAILAYLLKPNLDDGRADGDGDGPPRVPTVKQDMTLRQLREYNGTKGKPIYVAVKGQIFNVSSHPSGIELYGGDSPYTVFAGREATVGLARGNFDIEEEYDLKKLTMFEYDNLEQWYHWTFMAKYDEVGRVIPEPEPAPSDGDAGDVDAPNVDAANGGAPNSATAESSKAALTSTAAAAATAGGGSGGGGGGFRPGSNAFAKAVRGKSAEEILRLRSEFLQQAKGAGRRQHREEGETEEGDRLQAPGARAAGAPSTGDGVANKDDGDDNMEASRGGGGSGGGGDDAGGSAEAVEHSAAQKAEEHALLASFGAVPTS